MASDGSTDRTSDLVLTDGRARCVAYPDRRGKMVALNLAVAQATGDLLVFVDARQELAPGAISALVAHFNTPTVGVVSGTLVHRDPGTGAARDVGAYWRYERAIRMAESRWYSVVGATGALYAIRRQDYVPARGDTILDDFEVPMQIVRRGRRALIESGAVMYDDLQSSSSSERRRKIRTLAGNFQSFLRNLWLFSPRENPIFVQFMLHKVARLLIPYALLLAFIASALADDPVLHVCFGAQAMAYALVLLARSVTVCRRIPGVGLMTVFVDLNLAAVEGLFRYLRGRHSSLWEKTS